ncbi:putative protease S8 tripeptidyl peptidase I [Ramicandelaber brevisporus]|nr:putative protease S8 tripeptidyl peptidase I [Ramicandelaber brevisporus]
MRLANIVFLLSNIAAVSTGVLAFTHYVEFDKLDATPSSWVLDGPAPVDHVIRLQVGLKQQNVAAFNRRFMEISTPGHPHYGMHMTRDEVNEMLAPSSETARLVLEWMQSFGIRSVHEHQWITGEATVAQAQKLLQTQFNVYRSKFSNVTTIRTLAYSVPESLLSHIRIVTPATFFDQDPHPQHQQQQSMVTIPKLAKRHSHVPSSCNHRLTPKCIQKLYGIPKARPPQHGNNLAVLSFENKSPNKNDLELYLRKFRPFLHPLPTFSEVFIDGATSDPSDPSLGGNVATQTVLGLASGVPVSFVSVGVSNVTGMMDAVNYLIGLQTPPTVALITAVRDERDVTLSAATVTCNLMQQLGARGISVIIASGDGGVGGKQAAGQCTTFVPTFPTTCPTVTSVGATMGIQEVGAQLSAGGFSTFFGRPEYQAGAVDSYLASLGGQFSGLYNASGRAYPDVAAQGTNGVGFIKGQESAVQGTSLSVSIFASVIALLNDELIAHGKTPMGFLNPWLYQNAAALNDVTSGSNPGCGTNGFPATKGWDPVTGLGTPNYANMKRALGI